MTPPDVIRILISTFSRRAGPSDMAAQAAAVASDYVDSSVAGSDPIN
jgi:hypothetical protein